MIFDLFITPFPAFPQGGRSVEQIGPAAIKLNHLINMAYVRIINESKHLHGADLNTKSKARILRKSMTNAEKTLWNKLRRRQLNGIYFRRQHPYGIYILDFYCYEANLVIEVDGAAHLGIKEYDEERTQYRESSGLRVIRFRNEEIEENIYKVIEAINFCLNHDS